MTDRELDAQCAEIVGYRQVKLIPPGLSIDTTIPHYSTSLDACRELLEWASQKDYVTFVAVLWPKLLVVSDEDMYSKTMKVLRATPRQICEAFAQTFGGEK